MATNWKPGTAIRIITGEADLALETHDSRRTSTPSLLTHRHLISSTPARPARHANAKSIQSQPPRHNDSNKLMAPRNYSHPCMGSMGKSFAGISNDQVERVHGRTSHFSTTPLQPINSPAPTRTRRVAQKHFTLSPNPVADSQLVQRSFHNPFPILRASTSLLNGADRYVCPFGLGRLAAATGRFAGLSYLQKILCLHSSPFPGLLGLRMLPLFRTTLEAVHGEGAIQTM